VSVVRSKDHISLSSSKINRKGLREKRTAQVAQLTLDTENYSFVEISITQKSGQVEWLYQCKDWVFFSHFHLHSLFFHLLFIPCILKTSEGKHIW